MPCHGENDDKPIHKTSRPGMASQGPVLCQCVHVVPAFRNTVPDDRNAVPVSQAVSDELQHVAHEPRQRTTDGVVDYLSARSCDSPTAAAGRVQEAAAVSAETKEELAPALFKPEVPRPTVFEAVNPAFGD